MGRDPMIVVALIVGWLAWHALCTVAGVVASPLNHDRTGRNTINR